MEIGDDFLPELDFDFIEQEEEDEVVDDKVVNDDIPEEEDDNLDDDSEDESSDNVDTDDNAVAAPIIEYATLKDDVTPEEVANFLMQYQPPSFTEQDLQNDNDLAENYLTNSLKAEGLDDEEIEDRIDYLKDRNQLAKESIRQFRKDEQVRQQEMNGQLEQVRQQEQVEQQQQEVFVQNFGQVLNNTNWRDDHKQVIAHEFTSGNFKTRMEHLFENPKALVKLVDFLANYDGEDINLDKYKKSAFSPSVKGVKDTVEKYWSSSSLANNKSSKGGNPKVDLSELELI